MLKRDTLQGWFIAALMLAPALRAAAVPITTTVIASGLNRADWVCSPPGDSQRLFFCERRGVIKIIDLTNNTVLAAPFLDIDSLVVNFPTTMSSGGDERGLLGMAFHPDYASNGYFYVYYIANPISPDTIGSSTIARYTVSGGDPNVADPGSALILKTVAQAPYGNHKGGCLQFGRDGKLYCGLGDGGNQNDVGTGHNAIGNGQYKGTLLAKIIRLDVDIPSPYVPGDNPFVGQAGVMPEIWAFGVRNPFRFSFDSLSGDFYLGDVGQNAIEEVDYVPVDAPAGANFGWRCMEGLNCFTSPSGTECTCGGANLVNPVLTYPHANNNICVIGGYVYRGSHIPGEYGNYFYGDDVSGRVWTLNISGGAAVNNAQRFTGQSPATFGVLSAIGQDGAGELYLVYGSQQGTSNTSGIIRKIVPVCDTAADINSDCAKNATDAQILVEVLLGIPQSDPAFYGRSDVNKDGLRDGKDIQAWISSN